MSTDTDPQSTTPSTTPDLCEGLGEHDWETRMSPYGPVSTCAKCGIEQDSDGPDNDDWIHAAYLRQAENAAQYDPYRN